MAELLIPSPLDNEQATHYLQPTADFDVNESGHPTVYGQQISGLFTSDELLNDPVLARPAQVFTNGADVHFEHRYRQFVETHREKKMSGKLDKYSVPSPSMFALMMLWAKRHKRHFFKDASFSVTIFASELCMTVPDLLSVRGWSVSRKKTGDISISYRRIRDCLEQYDPSFSGRFHQLYSILNTTFKYLNSRKVFHKMASEKPDDELLSDDDSDESESDSEEEPKETSRALPILGQSKLIDFRQEVSASGRQRRDHQWMQLGLMTVKLALGPALTKKQRENGQYLWKLVCIIFRSCQTPRVYAKTLQDILMVCRDRATIDEIKSELQVLLRQPEDLAEKIAKKNAGLPLEDYLADLWKSLRDKFTSSSINHVSRSLEREHIVVRVVVFMKIQALDRTLPSKSEAALALVGPNAMPTLVDKELGDEGQRKRKRTQAEEDLRTKAISLLASLTAPPVTTPKSATSALPTQANVPKPSTPARRNHHKTKIPYDSPLRWAEPLQLATKEEIRATGARLLVEAEHSDVTLHHAPMEMYISCNLDTRSHQFLVNKPDGPHEIDTLVFERPTTTIPDVGSLHQMPGLLSVARPGCRIFDEFFPSDFMNYDLRTVIQYILRNGDTDTSRSDDINTDETVKNKFGSRLEFGNAGLAMEPGVDGFKPRVLCIPEHFETDADGLLLRAIFGRIFDRMGQCAKRILEQQGRHVAPNFRRFDEFAKHLQDYLFAEYMKNEHCTSQLSNLSDGIGGVKHQDTLNDGRAGYSEVMCLGVTVKDNIGDLWNLKHLGTWRKRIGDYMCGSMTNLLLLVSRLRHFQHSIDAKYAALMGQYKGAYTPPKIPTCANHLDTFHLDDYMPFEQHVLSPSKLISQSYMVMPTSPFRATWLAGACSPVHELSPVLNKRGMVQMGALCSFQNNFHYFYIITRRMKSRASLDTMYPFLEFYDEACFLHGTNPKGTEYCGGPHPRFSPPGFNFREVFALLDPYSDEDESEEDEVARDKESKRRVDLLTEVLLELLEAVNDISGDGSTAIPRVKLQPLVLAANLKIKKSLGCELGEFRLLIFLQFCALLRIVLKPGRYMRSLLYPAEGTASFEHIIKSGFKAEEVDKVCEMLLAELGSPTHPLYMDELETMLCESCEGRMLLKFDVFIKGQTLFRLDDDGVPWMKEYSKVVWKRVPKRFKLED